MSSLDLDSVPRFFPSTSQPSINTKKERNIKDEEMKKVEEVEVEKTADDIDGFAMSTMKELFRRCENATTTKARHNALHLLKSMQTQLLSNITNNKLLHCHANRVLTSCNSLLSSSSALSKARESSAGNLLVPLLIGMLLGGTRLGQSTTVALLPSTLRLLKTVSHHSETNSSDWLRLLVVALSRLLGLLNGTLLDASTSKDTTKDTSELFRSPLIEGGLASDVMGSVAMSEISPSLLDVLKWKSSNVYSTTTIVEEEVVVDELPKESNIKRKRLLNNLNAKAKAKPVQPVKITKHAIEAFLKNFAAGQSEHVELHRWMSPPHTIRYGQRYDIWSDQARRSIVVILLRANGAARRAYELFRHRPWRRTKKQRRRPRRLCQIWRMAQLALERAMTLIQIKSKQGGTYAAVPSRVAALRVVQNAAMLIQLQMRLPFDLKLDAADHEPMVGREERAASQLRNFLKSKSLDATSKKGGMIWRHLFPIITTWRRWKCREGGMRTRIHEDYLEDGVEVYVLICVRRIYVSLSLSLSSYTISHSLTPTHSSIHPSSYKNTQDEEEARYEEDAQMRRYERFRLIFLRTHWSRAVRRMEDSCFYDRFTIVSRNHCIVICYSRFEDAVRRLRNDCIARFEISWLSYLQFPLRSAVLSCKERYFEYIVLYERHHTRICSPIQTYSSP